jgi:hypothetical protein
MDALSVLSVVIFSICIVRILRDMKFLTLYLMGLYETEVVPTFTNVIR